MFQMLAGPVVFAVGLCLIYVAVNGMPRALSQSFLGRLGGGRRAPVNGFTSQEALVGEMLTEMVTLREQLAPWLQPLSVAPQARWWRPAQPVRPALSSAPGQPVPQEQWWALEPQPWAVPPAQRSGSA